MVVVESRILTSRSTFLSQGNKAHYSGRNIQQKKNNLDDAKLQQWIEQKHRQVCNLSRNSLIIENRNIRKALSNEVEAGL